MALDFTDTSCMLNCGSAAILDDIRAGTIMAWVRSPLTTSSSVYGIVTKESNTDFAFFVDRDNSDIEFVIDRATTDCGARTSTGITANVWTCLAWQWDLDGATADQRIYKGTTLEPMKELAYAARNVGAGNLASNAGSNWTIGNRAGGFTNFHGPIAWVGAWRRKLSLTEIEEQRLWQRVTPGCVGWWDLGRASAATRQLDMSGWGNHGTISGAVARGFHPSHITPYGWREPEEFWIEEAAVGGGGSGAFYYRNFVLNRGRAA